MQPRNKIRILVISHENPLHPNGGMGVYLNEVYNRLCKDSRFEITMLGLDGDDRGGFYLMGNEPKEVSYKDWQPQEGSWRLVNIISCNNINTKNGFLHNLILEDSYLYNLIALKKNNRFDLVHLHDMMTWRATKHAQQLFGAPIIFTTHMNQQLTQVSHPKDDLYMWIIQNEREAYRVSDCLTTVSEYYRNELLCLYNPLQVDIDVIHNGVDYEGLSKVPYDAELRKQFDDRPLVVFVGRFVMSKGINRFFRAVYELQDFNFLFISMVSDLTRDYSPHMKTLEQAERMCGNFKFYNQKSNELKKRYMKIADIGVMPSLQEPFGITALEWMSLGVSLITCPVGGLPEFCNKNNCTLSKPDIESFVEAIRNHKRDEEKIKQGIETAKAFSWEKTVGQLAALYERESIKWGKQSN